MTQITAWPRHARRTAAVAVLAAAMLVPISGSSGAATHNGGSKVQATPYSALVDKVFTGTQVSIGVSNDGNVNDLNTPTSPTVISNVNTEGYVACYNGTTVATDIYGDQLNWGPSTTTFPTATTMRVVRTTSDGKLKLQQDLTFSASAKKMTVKNTLTNVSTSTLTSIWFTRGADFDADNTYNNLFGRSAKTVFAWTDGGPTLALIQHVSASPGVTFVSHISDWDGIYCQSGSVTPTGPGDYAASMSYAIGDLAPGKSKTVTIAYSGA